jgi:A/G-specific adenine glycosylase
MSGPQAPPAVSPGSGPGAAFAVRVLAWFDHHGRRDLPWQQEPTPYRVWISEVMLQQTRVATVMPYYQRFLARFPDLATLATAPLDEVLAHWSGLGYYARARHLHATAGKLLRDHGGAFPMDLEQLQNLPGIGRSTAGAILSLAGGQRAPILDGNVKRVLARYCAVPGWPGSPPVLRRLWQLAEELTPRDRVAAYNQAMMDLGATLCTRTRPACATCPLAQDCQARAAGDPTRYPAPKPRRALPLRRTHLLLLRNPAGELLLEQRPPLGVWGGLWSLPECSRAAAIPDHCRQALGLEPAGLELLPPRRHTFSHFQLEYIPVRVSVIPLAGRVAEDARYCWLEPAQPPPGGVPAPVAQLIHELHRPSDRSLS